MILYIFFHTLSLFQVSLFVKEQQKKKKTKVMIFTKSSKVVGKSVKISELSVTKLLDICISYQHKG